jgi:hypothetical protein
MAGSAVALLSSSILGARAKKTQPDKDWPMIRRLLEADFFNNRDDLPDPARLLFWLRELRTPEWLVVLCNDFRELAMGNKDYGPSLGRLWMEGLMRWRRLCFWKNARSAAGIMSIGPLSNVSWRRLGAS